MLLPWADAHPDDDPRELGSPPAPRAVRTRRLARRAALPGLHAIVERWRPDLIVRESWEFASTLVAEAHGIPLARVGLGLASVEEQSIALAAPAVDAARARIGLPADPAGDRLRDAPYLTMVPEALVDRLVAIVGEGLRTPADRNAA